MKLTLSVGGGFTGLTKESSIDVKTLNASTSAALMKYFQGGGHKKTANLNEFWLLNDDKEVPIDQSKMNDDLRALYVKMKKKLSYSTK